MGAPDAQGPRAVENPAGELIDGHNGTSSGKSPMSKGDRDQLAGIVRMRARVARSAVAQREAELLADFERQLATRFDERAAAWTEATSIARAAVAEADRVVAKRCAEQGIAEEFRPRCQFWWSSRGENADPARRAELRKVATARVAAAAKAAKYTIEARQVEALTALVAATLDTESARSWLETIPTAEALMPTLALAELEAAMPTSRSWRHG